MSALSRRAFLQSSAAAAVAASAFPPSLLAAGHKISPIGLELYTVRNLLDADLDGTLAKVAAAGYKEVEFPGYRKFTPAVLRAAIDRAGLVSPSTHIDYKTVVGGMPQAIDAAHILGHKFLVNPSIDEAVISQPDGWKHAAEAFNRAGEACKNAGLQFAYHNHWAEFKPMPDGALPYDVLLQECDAKLVAFEMDLCWVNVGGGDPIAYFKRYPGRFPLVHVKDMKKLPHPSAREGAAIPEKDLLPEMTEVGIGVIDWKHLFANSGKAGIQHYFVEHDAPADPIASITTSYAYLSALRF